MRLGDRIYINHEEVKTIKFKNKEVLVSQGGCVCPRNERSDESFTHYLDQYNYAGISKVTILAVVNFGGYKETWDNTYDEERESLSVSRFNSVMNFFKEKKIPVKHFSKNIDEDFCYGISSKKLIITTGGFSLLMKQLSMATPPPLKLGFSRDCFR